MPHDVIVIGAGHNGLACACYLARAGLDVLVLERTEQVGGMTTTEELTLPGFRSDVHASGYQLASLSPAPAELGVLDRIELIDTGVPWGHAFGDGDGIAVDGDLASSVATLARRSRADAAAWERLFDDYMEGRDALVSGLFSPPPSFVDEASAMTGTPGGLDRYRFSLQSMRSWCDEHFETPEAKALFGAFAPFVGNAPDDAGGAEITWLFACVLQDAGNRLVRGGMHGVTLALADDLRANGGEIRTGVHVTRVEAEHGRAVAVQTAEGERLPATRAVAAAVDPPQLVRDLLGEDALPDDVVADMRRYELGDAAMAIYLALDGPVEYDAGEALGRAAHVHLTPPSVDALADSAAETRAGLLPRHPLLVMWNDSTVDPTRAPSGQALKKLVVIGVPYEIRGDATGRVAGRSWDEAGEAYADHLLDLVDDRYLPGLRDHVLAREVRTPLDMEQHLATAVRGTIGHGAMLPYQMGFMRPIPQLARYRAPVEGVYLAASGAHPGPGVSMGPGRNAARTICGDLGVGFPGET